MCEPCESEPAALGVTKTQGAPQIEQAAGIGPESGSKVVWLSALGSISVKEIEISRCSISTDTRRVRFIAAGDRRQKCLRAVA